jgi:hypothetical protein
VPRGDRTGPWGQGPMTGRAAGYCAGYPVPGFMNPIPGFGRKGGFGRGRRGRGRGFGRGWWAYPPQYQHPYPQLMYPPVPPQPYAYPPAYPSVAQPQTPEHEVAALENYKKELEAERADLEQEMGEIASRIEELRAKLEQTEKKKQ